MAAFKYHDGDKARIIVTNEPRYSAFSGNTLTIVGTPVELTDMEDLVDGQRISEPTPRQGICDQLDDG